MGFRSWVSNLFRQDNGNIRLVDFGALTAESIYMRLAIESAIDLIANTLVRTEFQTFEKKQRVKRDNYYLFNVSPNVNEDKYKFLHHLIHEIIYQNEALVVMMNDQLFVADGFQREEFALKGNRYSNVRIENLTLNRTFEEHEVFYFKMYQSDVRAIIEKMYENHGKLIEYSRNTYKRSNARRGTLEIPTNFSQLADAKEKLEKLMNEQMKNFFEAEKGAVLPLTNGMKYEDLTNQTYKNGSDSRDIRSLIDDVFDFVSIAFHIPPQLLKGTLADSDQSFQNFMMFCIKPFAEMLEKEINRKMYDKKSYLERTYLHIETNLLKVSDLKDLSQSLDVLMRIGANTLDDTLEALGREGIGGELGGMRFLTLNYVPMEQALKGGETVEEKN